MLLTLVGTSCSCKRCGDARRDSTASAAPPDAVPARSLLPAAAVTWPDLSMLGSIFTCDGGTRRPLTLSAHPRIPRVVSRVHTAGDALHVRGGCVEHPIRTGVLTSAGAASIAHAVCHADPLPPPRIHHYSHHFVECGQHYACVPFAPTYRRERVSPLPA